MSDESAARWEALNRTSRMHTITVRYPLTFRKAVAASLGRPGEMASLAEIDAFIREAIRLNVDALIAEHFPPVRSKLKARVHRPDRQT